MLLSWSVSVQLCFDFAKQVVAEISRRDSLLYIIIFKLFPILEGSSIRLIPPPVTMSPTTPHASPSAQRAPVPETPAKSAVKSVPAPEPPTPDMVKRETNE